MAATPEYQIKYLNSLIWDIFKYYLIQDSIISVEFSNNKLMDEFKFEYYLIDIPTENIVDEIENDLEERIRNSFKVNDAYVFLKISENKIEIIIYDEMVLTFDSEAMIYMREDKINNLLD